MDSKTALQPDSLTKQKFRSEFLKAVESGHIQYLPEESSCFTLVLSRSAQEKLGNFGVRICPLQLSVIGHADGINMRFEQALDWYDKDSEDANDKGKNFGLMTYFDNNMDALMSAIHGIRVVQPTAVTTEPRRGGTLTVASVLAAI